VAALMLVAVLGFWWLQWQAAPAAGDAPQLAAGQHAQVAGKAGRHDRDDD
jgi:hypothetical protein